MSRSNEFQDSLPGMGLAGQKLNVVKEDDYHYDFPDEEPDNKEQLALWKTPKEIMKEYRPLSGDMKYGESKADTWRRKAQEGKTGMSGYTRDAADESDPNTLANSIKREGVKNPVSLQFKDFYDKPEVFGGHHRIATANDIDPNMLIPVSYSESMRHSATVNRSNRKDDFGNGFPKNTDNRDFTRD